MPTSTINILLFQFHCSHQQRERQISNQHLFTNSNATQSKEKENKLHLMYVNEN